MKKLILLVTTVLIGTFSAFSQGPAITSIDPASGMPGTVITITGTGLSGVTAVRFGGTPARSFAVNSDTSVSAVVGSGSSGPVEVETADSTANFPGFTFIVPTVTLVKQSDGSEGGQPVRFTVSYPDGYVPVGATTITYEIAGSAEAGADYAVLPGTLVIPAGSVAAELVLEVADDQVLEGPEEVSIRLTAAESPDGEVGFDPRAVAATITDNDSSSALSLALQNNGSEPGGNILFRISLPPGVTSSVPTSIDYQTGGSATAGSDYTAPGGTLVLPAGENSADLLISILDDDEFEGPETLILTLVEARNSVAGISVPESAEAVISDDEEDPAGRVLTLVRISDGEEGRTDVRFRVSFPPGISRPAESVISYTIGGTAEAGTDHSGSSGTVSIPAGVNSADIVIPITDDRVIEPEETITVTLTGAVSGATELEVEPQGPVTATVTDDDNTPPNTQITLEAAADGAEPGTDGRFEVRYPAGVTSSVVTTVIYQVGGTATPGSDYTALSGSVVIPAGANAATITVAVLDDDASEGEETVQLNLQSASSSISTLTVTGGPASVRITDDDENTANNVLTLSLVGAGAEGGSAVRFRVSYPQDVVKTFNTTVTYQVTGTATPGSDYPALPGSLVIPAGQNAVNLEVPVTDDSVIEPAETLILSLQSASVPAGVTTVVTVNQDPVTGSLADNDNTPANNRITVAAVADGAEPGTDGRFEVRFPPEITSSAATTVIYQAGGTATAGTDYTALPGTVVIPAGANAATITIAVQDDDQYEGEETVQLILQSALSGISTMTVDPAPAELIITENDENPANNVLTLTLVGPGAEGGSPARFRVSYPQGIVKTFNTTVTYQPGGTASAGSDYAALPGSLVIPAGQNFAELEVPVTDDQVIEPVETLVLTLRSAAVPAGATTVVAVNPDPVTAELADNDNTAANTRISLAAVSNGAEPGTNGGFEVRFPPGITSSVPTTVTYRAGGTATAGADYTALSGSVIIPAGANGAVVTVQVLDDRIMEGSEVVTVTLLGAVNSISVLTVTDTSGSVTLADNDNEATANAIILTHTGDGSEPGTAGGFRISFPENVTSSSNTLVTFSIGGTARNGTDYAVIQPQVVIPAGENGASIDVAVLDDQVLEGDETVILALTGATSADTALMVNSAAVSLVITDNDNTARNNVLTLVKEQDAAEPATDAVFVVRYPEGITSAASTTVSYRIGGTATNGTDYGRLSGSVEIPAGANSAEIRVATIDDQEIEITETVALTLQSAASAVSPVLTIGSTASVIANITDNDSSAPNTITLMKVQDGSEPGSNAVFRTSFPPGISSSAVTIVNYSTGGSAVNGTDYRALSGSVIIPAGSNSADIIVTVLDDGQVDPDETIELLLTSVSNSLTSLSTFPATPVAAVIRDDDIPAITAFSPVSGPAGTAVTISGEKFDARPENNIVFFGAVQATVTAATPGTLTVTAPAQATYEPVTVTVNGLTARAATSFGITFPNDAGLEEGGFDSRMDLPLGKAASYLAIGDIDGDGRTDLVTTHYQDRSVSVMLNTAATGGSGAGSFAPGADLTVGGNPLSAQVRDLDGDGKQDVIVIQEVVGTGDTTSLVSVFRNAGSAGDQAFGAALDLVVPGRAPFVGVADMNGDGKPDLVTTSSTDPLIRIFRNTGSPGSIGFEASGAYTAGAEPRGLLVTDLNGDGKPDVSVSDGVSDSILLFTNTTVDGIVGFELQARLISAGQPSFITAADFNGDGKADLAVVNGSGAVSVYMNRSADGVRAFEPAAEYAAGDGPGPVSPGDLDGDGRADLLVVPDISGSVIAIRNTGTAGRNAFGAPLAIGAGSRGGVRIADLNGDGKPDLVMIGPGDTNVSILLNDVDQPVLASVAPLTACEGSTITLAGSNLNGVTAVSFGDTEAASFTVVSSTTITVVVPAGAGGIISVTTPKGIVSRDGFRAVPVPAIAAGGPTTFATGGQVVLTATTGEGYRYQWQKDGTDLAGAAGPAYTATQSGSYRVRILDGDCGPVSDAIAVNAIFTLPPANFTVAVTSESCRSSDNGEIEVKAEQPLDYTATLTGPGKNLSARFTASTRFTELPAGTYNICLTVDGQPDYRLCYDLVVSEPEDLAVYTAVNPIENTVDLMLSGSDSYYVELNGETRTVKGNRATLNLRSGLNRLKVSTGKDCQGTVERVIMTGTTASVYPNPFESILNVSLPQEAGDNARIQITNAGGKVVYSGRFVNRYGNIRMDLPDLETGIYFLKLSTDRAESVYKIIRK